MCDIFVYTFMWHTALFEGLFKNCSKDKSAA